jgi:hypothetical protein
MAARKKSAAHIFLGDVWTAAVVEQALAIATTEGIAAAGAFLEARKADEAVVERVFKSAGLIQYRGTVTEDRVDHLTARRVDEAIRLLESLSHKLAVRHLVASGVSSMVIERTLSRTAPRRGQL